MISRERSVYVDEFSDHRGAKVPAQRRTEDRRSSLMIVVATVGGLAALGLVTVDIAQLIKGVGNALNGCEARGVVAITTNTDARTAGEVPSKT